MKWKFPKVKIDKKVLKHISDAAKVVVLVAEGAAKILEQAARRRK